MNFKTTIYFFLLIIVFPLTGLSQESIIETTPSLKKGYDYFENGDFVACIQQCDSVLNLKNITTKERYGANELMAGSHYSMGDVRGALKFKLKMISYANAVKLKSYNLYYAYDHLATIYADLNRVEDAIKASERAFKAVKTGNLDTSMIILASNNLGYRLLLDNRNTMAIEYYQQGIKYYNELQNKRKNDSLIYHVLLGNLGFLQGRLGDDSGIDKLKITLAFLDKKNFNRADPRIKLAKLYFMRKDYKRAETLLNESSSIAHDYDQNEMLEMILFEKTLLYAALKDQPKLNAARAEYSKIQLKNRINENGSLALEELSELKLNKLKSEQKSLRDKIKVTDQQKKINALILLIGIILVVVILVILLILYRKRKTENLRLKELHEIKGQLLETKLEKETKELENITKWFEIQKKEMSVLLVSSKTKEEQLENMIKDLKDLKKNNGIDVNTILSDIQIKLNSIASSPEEKELSSLDKLQISSFRNALIEKHPSLTPNEIDLCMMIVSGMDSKKIGNIKNISPSSVRTNKSRLKKKLDLSADEDLHQYLIKISAD